MSEPSKRYPYEPLARIVAAKMGLPYCPGKEGCAGCTQQMHAGPGAVGRWLGVSESAPLRWVQEGGIPEPTVDKIMTRNDLHPSLIPGWDWAAEDDLEHDDPFIAQTSLFA